MKRWMLINVIDRDICNPEMFDTYEQAQTAMREQLAEMMNWKPDEIEMNLMEDDCGDVGFNDTSAWGERFGTNSDWCIFHLEDDGNWIWYFNE